MSLKRGLRTVSPPHESPTGSEPLPRLYVFESGWRVNIKHGNHREFCHVMAPGQDFYHRLLDGEIYIAHGEERLCLRCAVRHGIIAFEPRRLRNPIDPSLADSSELPVFDVDSGDL